MGRQIYLIGKVRSHSIISSCDVYDGLRLRTPHSTTLESKMLTIAYERYDNHFLFYTQIEN
ncbi:hypothetical protein [Nostoc sp.]|uniref:hypothetical protein n=1 Tax=Nostoc sp. TaxID=1180 RepID=UPI002FF25C72